MISSWDILLCRVLLLLGQINSSLSRNILCRYYTSGPKLNVFDLVGNWVTVYTQPKAVKCFMLKIKAVTEIEQQELHLRYGNFTGFVDWSSCYLEVESSFGKHFFQGDGSEAGVLENIIIFKSAHGQYMLQEQSADQWTIYGEADRKLVVMRDCAGKASAVFARVPYWPTPHQLYAVLYRSGVKPQTLDRIPCEANEINNH